MFTISRCALVAFLISTFCLFAVAASAQSPSCDSASTPGTCLPWGFTDLTFVLPGQIVDLSKDGSALAGEVGLTQVYRWKLDTGTKVLNLTGTETLTLGRTALSADGKIVVGNSQPGGPLANRVFRWDVDNVVPDTTLLLPAGPTMGIPNVFPTRTNGEILPATWGSVSADGNTIVGNGTATDDVGLWVDSFWGFRWTAAGGTTDITQEPFSERFTPLVVAGDGLTIAGQFGNSPSSTEAAIWDPSGGASGTGTNLGVAFSSAVATSFDGQVVGGWRPDLQGTGIGNGFSWTQAGGVVELGPMTRPRAMSDDGNIITSMQYVGASRQPWIEVGTLAASESMFGYLGNHFGFHQLFGTGLYGVIDPLGIVSGDGTVFSMVGARWVAKATPINSVSLGDSYASGQGVLDFESDTADDGVNECHRSFRAYSTLFRPRGSFHAMRLLGDASIGEVGFSWHFLACSDALTNNVRTAGAGQWPGSTINGINHGLSQLEQLSQAVTSDDVDLVTITIGGNDVGFELIAKFCMKRIDCHTDQYNNTGTFLGSWFLTHVRTRVKPRLVATYEQIKLETPNAAVVVVGYPLLVAATECPDASRYDEDELKWFRTSGVFLNKIIAEAAAEAGVHFVPVAHLFENHEVCGSLDDWISPPKILTRNHEYGLHPTEEGQIAYAEAVTDFLWGKGIYYDHGFFESGLPKNPPPQP